jgi:hypothetical protein
LNLIVIAVAIGLLIIHGVENHRPPEPFATEWCLRTQPDA